MRAKRIVLWKEESDTTPPIEISETGSFRSTSSEDSEEKTQECSEITYGSYYRRFRFPSNRARRSYALGSREPSSTRLSRVPWYESRPSVVNIANSDCSSSMCSDSSVSLDVPSDVTELLDEEETARLRQAFQLFDQDCDGLITAQEMGAVMRTLGYEATDVEALRMVTEANASGKDNVNFAEFLAVLAQQSGSSSEDGPENMEVLFKVFDKYDRGYITAMDLRDVMSSINETVTDRELDAMMLAADKDGDGLISYEEFVAIFSSPDQATEEPA
ncbi:hypothetical protein HPB50_015075 [Hyalomma asiaticum]|uniref:Uncharacterized protein n=1 Tax=Hyalomma asiaticum TaxID=266040 RepID=A0ACB7SY81_HYAAI|nr:hypothetical protein HPB50_015075 [Hyalomma asiaticum]